MRSFRDGVRKKKKSFILLSLRRNAAHDVHRYFKYKQNLVGRS